MTTIPEALQLFCADLPRLSPGAEASTLRALRRFGRLSRRLRVLELGCGKGAATRVLARRFDGPIMAIDAQRAYLDELQRALRAEGIAERVKLQHADFSMLTEDFGTFDLLWAEGAAYVLGFERSLSAWWPLLAPGGRVAVTELCYLVERPNDDVCAYLSAINPSVTTVIGNTARAERSGYSVIDTMLLSGRDYRSYYGPVKQRILALRSTAEGSPELAAVIAEFEHELALRERFGDEFGWVFYLLEKPASAESLSPELSDDSPGSDDGHWGADGPKSRARRGASARPRDFDGSVAPVRATTYQKLEHRLAELIRQCGPTVAARVFAEVESSVQEVVRRRDR